MPWSVPLEVAALRRAFPVSGVGAYEERWERNDDALEDAHRVAQLAAAAIETQAEAVEVIEIDLTDDSLIGDDE